MVVYKNINAKMTFLYQMPTLFNLKYLPTHSLLLRGPCPTNEHGKIKNPRAFDLRSWIGPSLLSNSNFRESREHSITYLYTYVDLYLGMRCVLAI